MFSSQPTDELPELEPPKWWRLSTWSLRARLITAVVSLLALVCLVVGLVTVNALKGFLTDRVDAQLTNTIARAGNSRPSTDHMFPPGQPPGTISMIHVQDNRWVAALYNPDDNPTDTTADWTPLNPDQADAVLTDLSLDAFATRKIPLLGDYRVVLHQNPDGLVAFGLPLDSVDRTLSQYTLALILVSASALLATAAIGTWIIRRSLEPLRRVAATATTVSQLPLSSGALPELALSERVPERYASPHTEVGRVGGALNRLLGHVTNALSSRQESEDRMRQFLADASHELRTPLASIRGYAELTKRVPGPVPEEITHAVGRVESAAKRMGTLVDDLLLLARLDSGRSLGSAEVDLTRLVIDAVSDARVAGPQHNWRMDLPEDEVSVAGDSAGLHQVLSNLLANARTHTPAGTTVEVSLTAKPDEVQLTVRDDGPGIPEALLPEVFDRFTRADTSRSRAAGSSGLGLSIVLAVVAAHHGEVSVQSIPGCTEFTVTLPRVAAPESQEAHSGS